MKGSNPENPFRRERSRVDRYGDCASMRAGPLSRRSRAGSRSKRGGRHSFQRVQVLLRTLLARVRPHRVGRTPNEALSGLGRRRRRPRPSPNRLEGLFARVGGASFGYAMQWLSGLPFGENPVVQIGLLVASGIAVLAVLAIIYRFVFAHRLSVPGGRTRQPRLGLVDAFSLDGQRQLVLVRRDNVEHLVMIGGPNDVLVELQINRALAPVRENQYGASGNAAAPRRVGCGRAHGPGRTGGEGLAASGGAGRGPADPPANRVGGASRSDGRGASASRVFPAGRANDRAAGRAGRRPRRTGGGEGGGRAPTAVSGGRPQPRPVPPRSAMPPPITPTGAAGYRGNVTRLTEKQPQASPSGLPAAPQAGGRRRARLRPRMWRRPLRRRLRPPAPRPWPHSLPRLTLRSPPECRSRRRQSLRRPLCSQARRFRPHSLLRLPLRSPPECRLRRRRPLRCRADPPAPAVEPRAWRCCPSGGRKNFCARCRGADES